MNKSEPVAWMKQNGEVSITKGEAFCIPLYTTPHHASNAKQTKPLSDEEAEDIYDMWRALSSDPIKLVRAIEAKIRG